MSGSDLGLIVLVLVFLVFEVRTHSTKKQTQKLVSESRNISRRI